MIDYRPMRVETSGIYEEMKQNTIFEYNEIRVYHLSVLITIQ